MIDPDPSEAFTVDATLGMVGVAYVHPEGAIADLGGIWGADDLEWLSCWDGLRAFRLTELGAYCLGLSKTYDPSVPPSTLQLETGTNLVICQTAGALEPADRPHHEAGGGVIDLLTESGHFEFFGHWKGLMTCTPS